MKPMKLNNKRTMLVGLAFMSICAFWQVYDNVIPLILENTFRLSSTVTGAIMGIDNILALFMLPLFGALSDRTNTRIGKRMPYVLGGTAVSIVLMNLLPIADNRRIFLPFVVTLGFLLIAMCTYPYAAVMVALSFVTISLTKHGDSKPELPTSRLEAFAGED